MKIKELTKPFHFAQLKTLLIMSTIVITGGTFFYRYVEDWSWIDSLYFSIITLTTVGYGDLSPSTPFSKLFTCFYILSGVGIIFGFMDAFFRQRKVLVERIASKEKPENEQS